MTNDDAWRRVKPFRAVETARVRYLSEAECVRLVNACEPAFRNLVRGAMMTGCRYSELTAMRVADFNADAGVVTVRESKAGKPRHVVLTAEGQKLFATLTGGKLGSDPIFIRRDGGVWGKSHQLRPRRLRRRHDPRTFSDARNYGREHRDTDTAQTFASREDYLIFR